MAEGSVATGGMATAPAPQHIPTLAGLLDQWTLLPLCRALIQTGVVDALPAEGWATVSEIAKQCDVDAVMLQRAIRFAAGFGVFEEAEDASNGSLVRHTEQSLQLREGGSLHKKVCYRLSREIVLPYVDGLHMVLRDPSKSGFAHVNGGADYFTEWLPKHPESESLFGAYMSEASEKVIPLVTKAYPRWPGCNREHSHESIIVDVAGGNGHLLRGILQELPEQVRGVVFDLPSKVESSKRFWPEGDLMQDASRVSFVGGSFFDGPLPLVADVCVLKWILHDWADAQCVAILRNTAACLRAGGAGRVLVIDFLIPDTPNQYHISKFFDIHMAAGYGGKERTLRDLEALADEAGLVIKDVLPLPGHPMAIVEMQPVTDDAAVRDGAGC